MYKAATNYLLLKKWVNGFGKEMLIGRFRIPRWPRGKSTIARLMRVNVFAETKTNIVNLPLSRWVAESLSRWVDRNL